MIMSDILDHKTFSQLFLARESIVLFKALKNSKRRNKGNFMSKYNSNKIKLCGGGRQRYNYIY